MHKRFWLALLAAAVCMAGCDSRNAAVGEIDESSGEGMVIGADASLFPDGTAVQDGMTEVLDEETTEAPTVDTTPAATGGNIVNSGIVCEHGDFVYYFNKNDANSLWRIGKDGQRQRIEGIRGAIDINVLADCIIYQSKGICRYDMETGEIVRLSDKPCRNVLVWKDYIYYLKQDNDIYKPFRMLLDGSGEQELLQDVCSYLNVYEDRLYYVNGTDDGRIHCMGLDGSDDQRITSFGGVEEMVVSDGMIYYVSSSGSGNQLWKVSVDGTGDSRICEKKCRSINVYEDTIYFSNLGETALCAIKTDGSGYMVLEEVDCSNVNVTSEWVYYFMSEQMTYYRIRKDGTGTATPVD